MKKWSILSWMVVVMVIALSFSGCGGTENSSGNAAEPPDTNSNDSDPVVVEELLSESADEATTGSLCENHYMPVINGASWTYASSGGDVEPYSFTDNITEANPAGFTLFSTFDGLTKTQTWECSSEGLVALEYVGGGQASVNTSGVNATFDTTGMSGISLPNLITVGDSWSQTFTVHGVSTMDGGLVSETTGTVQINMTAIGIETIEVPAGSFEAIKIEVQTTLDFLISLAGAEGVPFLLSSGGYTWMVEGVGWVKSVSSATVMGTTMSDTLELISYTIPE